MGRMAIQFARIPPAEGGNQYPEDIVTISASGRRFLCTGVAALLAGRTTLVIDGQAKVVTENHMGIVKVTIGDTTNTTAVALSGCATHVQGGAKSGATLSCASTPYWLVLESQLALISRWVTSMISDGARLLIERDLDWKYRQNLPCWNL